MRQKILTICEHKFSFPMEAFVSGCKHRHSDNTIYLANNLRHWKSISKSNDWIDIMTSVISHETIHLAITKIEDDQISMALDNKFGHGYSYKNEYHGLCSIDKYKRLHK